MNVQQAVYELGAARLAVEQHPMCARFEDLGGAYRVLYPCGFQLDGVQATYATIGKAEALRRMLKAMERHWNEL